MSIGEFGGILFLIILLGLAIFVIFGLILFKYAEHEEYQEKNKGRLM